VIEVSVIVPTINEAENLPLLVPRIAAALAGKSYEIIVVDDGSTDSTHAVCRDLAAKYPLILLIRQNVTDGLGGAVLHGMAHAQGTYLVVMDADLQHPVEKITELLQPLRTNQADFVLGSRYIEGGGTTEGWTLYRKINSGVATWLAHPFAGRATDPMSGFFALRRDMFASARQLSPLGYKIGLELMCKCRITNLKEVPIHFGLRQHGQSKLTLTEQFRYLEHLSRLYDFKFPRASPAIKFTIATFLSWMTGLIAYASLRAPVGNPTVAVTIAYLPALAVTTLFHVRYVRTQRAFIPRPHPWVDFALISAAEWGACFATATFVALRMTSPTKAEIFLYPFAAATLVRYVLRKEFLHDIRGLRRDARAEELTSRDAPK
jgi:dolichol-phosphate mannosyltransferase